MYDIAIIGGGPGGYVAAIRAAQHGMKVLLIEKDAVGGTCLNRGCIPTKTLIYDSKLFHAACTSPFMKGSKNLSVDNQLLISRKRKVVDTLVKGLHSVIQSHGIDIAPGTGELIDGDRINVLGADGVSTTHGARNIILATGSRPSIPGFIDVNGRNIQTTDQALDDAVIPSKIVIIGGGVIGIEMATIYLNLGAQVTIIELLEDILAGEDADIRQATRRFLKSRNATLFLKAKARDIACRDETVTVTLEDQNGKVSELEVDKVLVATGREPVFEQAQATRSGIDLTGPFIKVNDHYATSRPGVFAIGDAVGGMMLAHKASAEAEAVIETILGKKTSIDSRMIPRCIWGPAEIGSVGMSEAEALATGRKIKIGRFPYTASGAALAMGNAEGFVKIVGDADSGEILGTHIIGEHATDLISEAVTVMKMEGVVEDLYEAIKPHPTLSETLMEAALDWNKMAIHMPKRR